jgi:BCCT, betaine/carnitine/choline family transporter
VGGVGIVLLISGGLVSLQAAAIASALPLAIVLLMMCIGTLKGLMALHRAGNVHYGARADVENRPRIAAAIIQISLEKSSKAFLESMIVSTLGSKPLGVRALRRMVQSAFLWHRTPYALPKIYATLIGTV